MAFVTGKARLGELDRDIYMINVPSDSGNKHHEENHDRKSKSLMGYYCPVCGYSFLVATDNYSVGIASGMFQNTYLVLFREQSIPKALI